MWPIVGFGRAEQHLVKLLAGAQAGEHDLDLVVRLRSKALGDIEDPYG